MSIIWSDEATLNYKSIVNDLLEKWPIDIAVDFEERTNNLLDQLKSNSKLCPPIKYKKLRKCVIHKNASLIYRIKSKNIQIVTFIFNRDDHEFY